MRSALLVLAAFGLFLSGCQPSGQIVGGQAREKGKAITKIVSLSPSATELILSRGPGDLLRGRTQSCNFPQQVASIPVVASVKPDYEKIAQIKPELIVLDGDLYGEADRKKIEELGSRVFVFESNTIDGFLKEALELSGMIGGETRMSEYADLVYRAREVSEADPINPKPKVAVIIPDRGGRHLIAGVDSFTADIVRASGGEPVGPKAKLFVPLDAEQALSLAPDQIVVAGPTNSATWISNDPRLKSLAAVKANRVVEVNPDVMLRKGSRMDDLINRLHRAMSGLAGQVQN